MKLENIFSLQFLCEINEICFLRYTEFVFRSTLKPSVFFIVICELLASISVSATIKIPTHLYNYSAEPLFSLSTF